MRRPAGASSRRIPEAVAFPFNIPTISGFGASGGLQLPAAGPQRHAERRRARRAVARRSSTRRASARSSPTSSPRSTRATRRSRSSSTARRRASSACRSTRSSRRCRPSLGGTYVNDFNRFGRLYRVYVQAEPEYRRKPRGHRRHLRPQQDDERDDPAVDAGDHHVGGRAPRSRTASTCCARSRSTACPAPATPRARRWRRSRRSSPRRMPAEMGFAYSSHVVPGEDRAAGRADLRHGDRLRLPAARRDVRELAAALGGAARLAAGRARRLLRRLARWATTTTSTCRSASSC